ncbi:MAG: hypothetical protein PSX80_00495 [bacterium]|nr:hypothetical protein [bacterium]
MFFSAFQHDDTMGLDLGAALAGALSPIFGTGGIAGSVVGQVKNNAREVVIEIKGTVSNVGMWFINEPEWIAAALGARGWDIRNSSEIQTPIGGLGQRTWRITAMVGSQFSDSQIVTNARNHLVDRGMSVASVNIVQASAASYVSGSATVSGGDGTNAGTSISSLLAGTSVGLGVSSTVLIVGGAAIAILLLRRK